VFVRCCCQEGVGARSPARYRYTLNITTQGCDESSRARARTLHTARLRGWMAGWLGPRCTARQQQQQQHSLLPRAAIFLFFLVLSPFPPRPVSINSRPREVAAAVTGLEMYSTAKKCHAPQCGGISNGVNHDDSILCVEHDSGTITVRMQTGRPSLPGTAAPRLARGSNKAPLCLGLYWG
jgi:hypothetical protein